VRDFFRELVSFISSGKVLACILEGNDAINVVRTMVGVTKSYEASPGTIRGDFGLGLTDNIIHASDSHDSFIKESQVVFGST
jgi:nucleoside-diphosphate kinase